MGQPACPPHSYPDAYRDSWPSRYSLLTLWSSSGPYNHGVEPRDYSTAQIVDWACLLCGRLTSCIGRAALALSARHLHWACEPHDHSADLAAVVFQKKLNTRICYGGVDRRRA